ncbi:MAG: DNA-directed RNA polymerase subunit H [Candidatus Freyarchaeota archaeon]|nr:DNA-directed RNA polymerase subunit H [Candidatus Jordarchaeia archaeon]
MEEFKADRGAIIGGKRSTPNAEEVAEEGGVELLVDYPRFNIFEHELVPKHEVISEEERRWLLETFHVREDQLPKIKDTDPAVKAIGAKPGDVIKITRKSPTAGETIFYRYVVKAKYVPQIAREEYGLVEEGGEEEAAEEEWEEL